MKGLCIDLFKNYSLGLAGTAGVGTGTRSSRAFTHPFQRRRSNYQNQKHFSSSKLTCSSYSTKPCSATLSAVTAEVEEAKQTFNPEKAGLLVKELRKSFNSGRTKSYEWRRSQLENIAKMLEEKEKEITEALYKDLSKPEIEAFISECDTPIQLYANYTSERNVYYKHVHGASLVTSDNLVMKYGHYSLDR